MSHRYQSLPSIIKDLQGVQFSLRDMNATCYLLFPCCRVPSDCPPASSNPAFRLPPSGPRWLHEIKHDGYRLMARRDPIGIRLLTRNGHDWAPRYPLIVETVGRLKVHSCLIDGEAVACDENGLRCSNG